MTVPDKSYIVRTICKKYNCSLIQIKRKQIMFEGKSDGRRVVICTPSSKVHPQGNGWFDLNTKQVELLDDSDIAILAVRLEGNKIYYLDFKELRKLMTPNNMLKNFAEGEHWKLFIWETHIQVQGNYQKFIVHPEQASLSLQIGTY